MHKWAKVYNVTSVRKRDITDSYLQREPWAMSPQRVITQLYVSRLKEKLLLSNFICSSTLPAHQQTSHKKQKSPAGEHRGAFSSAAAGCFWRSDTELKSGVDVEFTFSNIQNQTCFVALCVLDVWIINILGIQGIDCFPGDLQKNLMDQVIKCQCCGQKISNYSCECWLMI